MSYSETLASIVRNESQLWTEDTLEAGWEGVVSTCESGYDDNIYELAFDLRVRDVIQLVLDSPELRPFKEHEEFVERVKQIDERFMSISQPIPDIIQAGGWWRARLPKYGSREFAEGAKQTYGVNVEITDSSAY